MSHELNPYAPPQHDGPAATGDSAGEAIRREHINAEANVKTVGSLLYLGAVASIVGGVTSMQADPINGWVTFILGGAMGMGGYWLHRLDARGRMAYTVVTLIGMGRGLFFGELSSVGAEVVLAAFAWPIVLLAIVWGQKASTVMTPHYRDVVIPATPHVKRKASVLVIVLGVILLALLAFAVTVAVFAYD
jgi:hypothetical protein